MLGVSAFVIALYLAVLVLALTKRGHYISHPWLFLLRGFFPSWRFFDSPGPQPRLFVRALSANDHWSEWSLFLPRAHFRLRDLFYNPENNLRLTEQTLVEHLSLDLQILPDDQEVEKLVSYALAKRLARRMALTLKLDEPMIAYQFQLCLMPGLGADRSEDRLMVSPIIKEADHAS